MTWHNLALPMGDLFEATKNMHQLLNTTMCQDSLAHTTQKTITVSRWLSAASPQGIVRVRSAYVRMTNRDCLNCSVLSERLKAVCGFSWMRSGVGQVGAGMGQVEVKMWQKRTQAPLPPFTYYIVFAVCCSNI